MAKPLPFSSGGGAIASLPANSWPRRRTMLLLFLAIMIVAADKSVFAFAGVRIMDDLQLSPTVFGGLGSAFFVLYPVAGVACGFLANRVAARWILLGLALIWAACQLGVALGHTVTGLFICRLLLGIGAGPSTALIQHACFKWFAPQERVLPAAGINTGLMAGILLSAVTLPWLISHHGWRTAYAVLAGLSLAWALLWLWLGREGQVAEAAQHLVIDTEMDAQPLRHAYRHLLLNRSFIGVTVLGFVGYLLSGLGFSWNPVWMQKGLGYSAQQTGVRVMLIMLLVIGWMLAVSWWSQRLLKRGASQRLTLVGLPVGCCVIGGVALALLGLHLPLGALGKLVLAGVGMVMLNVQQSFGITVCGEFSPPAQRGAVLAVHLALTTCAGMVAPVLAGYLVHAAHDDIAYGFENTLAVVGMATVIVALACLRWVDPAATRRRLQLREAARRR
ncbi:MFS transporter [Silvimonas sp. JCM 19000]